jgi:outer membrane lipoprotein-sorting protein
MIAQEHDLPRIDICRELTLEDALMRRLLFLACSMISVAATAAVSTDLAPAAKLSAAQIVDRNVAARGGLAAWRAVGTLTLSGDMDAGGKQDTTLPFVMTMKRPHMSRLEIRFQDQTAVQVYDGAQGWKLRPFLNRNDVDPFTPAEIKSAASWAELDGPLIDYAKKGSTVGLLGMEPVEGHSAYKLKLTLKGGEERNVWIDAKSFLELKIDGEPRRIDGRMHKVAIYYRNYKSEHGLNVPRVLETVVEGVKQTHKMTIKQLAVGQPVDDTLFAKPVQTVAKVSGND